MNSNDPRRHARRLKATTALVLSLSAPMLVLHQATAQVVAISDSRTTVVTTAAADNGAPADVTIDADGTIEVTAGAGVIVNSDNDVTNNGTIGATAETGAVGIHVITNVTDPATGAEIPDPATGAPQPADRAGDIVNNSAITVSVPDANVAAGQENFGILISGDGRYFGDITTTTNSAIRVDGDDSAGIAIRAPMVGNINADGTIAVSGINGRGILIENSLTGDIINDAGISASNQGGVGILLSGDVDGALVNNGSVRVGASATFDSNGNRIDAVSGQAAVRIGGDLSGGFLNNQFTTAIDDGDGNPANDVVTSTVGTLSAIGNGRALLITPDAVAAKDIMIGAVGVGDDAFGVINRGSMGVTGGNLGQDVTAVRIEGLDNNGSPLATIIAGGFFNQAGGVVSADTVDGDAVAISIGANAVVPVIRNDGGIAAQTTESMDDDMLDVVTGGPFGGDTYGILIEEGATVGEVQNNGQLRVISNGPQSSAHGIVDLSGTVSRFINTGGINAVVEPDGTGRAFAVDLSKARQSIFFSSSGTINGDVLLGDFDDDARLTGGALNGLLDLGGGFNSLRLSGNVALTGGLMGSHIDLDVSGSARLTINSTTTAVVDQAIFRDGSSLFVEVDAGQGKIGSLVATGDVRFEAGTTIMPQLISFLSNTQTFSIVQAGSLTVDPGATIEFMSSSFLFSVDFEITPTSIDLILNRKTAQELALSDNVGQVFDASFTALAQDRELGSAIANLETRDEIDGIFTQLAPMPNGGTRQLAILSEAASFGAVSRRIASRRAMVAPREGSGLGSSGFWIEEIGSLFDQAGRGGQTGFDGGSIGIVAGLDSALLGLDVFGVSIGQSFSELSEKQSLDKAMFIAGTSFKLYSSLSLGRLFIDAAGGYGFNSYDSERVIEIADIARTSNGKWKGRQISGRLAAGLRLGGGALSLTPLVSVSYLKLRERAYGERDGGAGVDLAFDKRTSESLVATAGAAIGYRKWVGDDGHFDVELRGSVAAELKDDAPAITAAFAAGGDRFTVTGVAFDKQYFQAGAGIGFSSDISSLTFDYDMERKQGFTAHVAGFTFRMRF